MVCSSLYMYIFFINMHLISRQELSCKHILFGFFLCSGQNVTVKAKVDNGSDVWFFIDYGDGSSENVTAQSYTAVFK